MNMAQRAARHQKMEGLLAYAAAYGEDAEAERLRSMFARLITSLHHIRHQSVKIWYNMRHRGSCFGITEKEVCRCRVITT